LFLTEIAIHLGNGTRAHGCYGMVVGNHRWHIDSCQFWWPWV